MHLSCKANRISNKPVFVRTNIPEDLDICICPCHTKSQDTLSCDQLRPISITPNLAKVAKGFIYRSLLQQIALLMDMYQYDAYKALARQYI